MTLETDLLLDRHRLKRRLFFWRSFAILALLVAVLVAVHASGVAITRDHVARLDISGLITDNAKLTHAVEKLAGDSSVKALIVRVDSPGGSVAGGESLHDAIAEVAAKKPVVVCMGALAASAAYMISVPATRIYAHEGTLTGSIGVLLEAPEVGGLLSKLGVDVQTIVSGPLKNQPSLTAPLSPQGQQVLQGLVMDLYGQFVAMVAAGRHMDPAKVRQLGDGRAYTGQQALQLGLIDAIGGEHDAREWLARNKGVPESLPVEDVSTESFAERTLSGTLGPIVTGVWKSVISQGVMLDGAWAVWHRSGD
ncbi:MAG TPA: signal peptide peptidase SppA [Acetobacteraceae bacterium]|nr:signal peptide peptidase SppA [Acetobacteraceae bacterium]